MDMIPETFLENCFIDETIRQKHKKNEAFLKLALTNVKLAKDLGLREGLTYDCTDRTYFNIRLPNNERVFKKYCGYDFQESRTIAVYHYLSLKNNTEVPVNLERVVSEVSTAYPPLTTSLRCRCIRNCLSGPHKYSRKLFEFDASKNTVKPKILPVDIEL